MEKQKIKPGLSKQARLTYRLYNERKKWEQLLHALHLANTYKEAGTEKEMKCKIKQWRQHAQEGAMILLPYYRDLQGDHSQVDERTAMLTAIGIDPAILHYSAELGDWLND